ncbi:MAG: sulfatase family protein [Candidatus Helarchaeota archaeon]
MNKLNLLILNLDDVRYDHLSYAGYEKNITPNLDELADNSIFFKNAFSSSSHTLLSIISQFTGKYPSHHKIWRQAPFLRKTNMQLESNTLPQILKKFGYKTFGVGYFDAMRPLFYKGFDIEINVAKSPLGLLKSINFDPYYLWGLVRIGAYGHEKFVYYINKVVERWIQKNIKKNPFLIFVNYANAHAPWHAPLRFRRIFEIKSKRNKKLENLLGDPSFSRRFKQLFVNLSWPFSKLIKYIIRKFDLTNEDLRILISRYDAEIAYLDHMIGKLIKFLEKKNLFDDIIIIITSDHGESFGEHHLLFHDFHLYDHLIHIPLLMKIPFKESITVNEFVSNVDILPTILDFLEIENKWEMDGKSFASFKKSEFRKYIIAELDWRSPKLISRILSNYKNFSFDINLILQPQQCIRTKKFKLIKYYNGKIELFNILKDPNEEKNIFSQFENIGRNLEKVMNRNIVPMEKLKEMEKIKAVIPKLKI